MIADLAVSIRLCTGVTHAVEPLFQQVMARTEALYDARAELVDLWRERTHMLGRRVRARRGAGEVEATVLGVSDEGHLQVQVEGGEREEWMARVDLELL